MSDLCDECSTRGVEIARGVFLRHPVCERRRAARAVRAEIDVRWQWSESEEARKAEAEAERRASGRRRDDVRINASGELGLDFPKPTRKRGGRP